MFYSSRAQQCIRPCIVPATNSFTQYVELLNLFMLLLLMPAARTWHFLLQRVSAIDAAKLPPYRAKIHPAAIMAIELRLKLCAALAASGTR